MNGDYLHHHLCTCTEQQELTVDVSVLPADLKDHSVEWMKSNVLIGRFDHSLPAEPVFFKPALTWTHHHLYAVSPDDNVTCLVSASCLAAKCCSMITAGEIEAEPSHIQLQFPHRTTFCFKTTNTTFSQSWCFQWNMTIFPLTESRVSADRLLGHGGGHLSLGMLGRDSSMTGMFGVETRHNAPNKPFPGCFQDLFHCFWATVSVLN